MIRTMALAMLVAASLTAHASDQKAPKADPAKAKPIVEAVCVGCHGADGVSPAGANPHLAGQNAQYLMKQLSNFRSVDGKPPVRDNAIMAGMAATLSDEDVVNVAAYYAAQKPAQMEAKDEKLVAEGQKLWRMGDYKRGIPACAGCHGPAGAGLPAQYPRLAGQWPEYTEAQLKAFRVSERQNDPEKMMQMIATKMTDQQIKAVAEYAAGLR